MDLSVIPPDRVVKVLRGDINVEFSALAPIIIVFFRGATGLWGHAPPNCQPPPFSQQFPASFLGDTELRYLVKVFVDLSGSRPPFNQTQCVKSVKELSGWRANDRDGAVFILDESCLLVWAAAEGRCQNRLSFVIERAMGRLLDDLSPHPAIAIAVNEEPAQVLPPLSITFNEDIPSTEDILREPQFMADFESAAVPMVTASMFPSLDHVGFFDNGMMHCEVERWLGTRLYVPPRSPPIDSLFSLHTGDISPYIKGDDVFLSASPKPPPPICLPYDFSGFEPSPCIDPKVLSPELFSSEDVLESPPPGPPLSPLSSGSSASGEDFASVGTLSPFSPKRKRLPEDDDADDEDGTYRPPSKSPRNTLVVPGASPRKASSSTKNTKKGKAAASPKPKSPAKPRHPCDCGSSFSRAKDLERHQDTSCENREKPTIVCNLCGTELGGREDSLSRHQSGNRCRPPIAAQAA